MSRSILAVHDGGSGCMFYRVRTPLEALAANGWDVTFLSAGDDGARSDPGRYGGGVKVKRALATQSAMEGYDVVVGHRVNIHSGLEAWRRTRGPFNRLVYETDDDVFSVGPQNWKAYHLYTRGDILDAISHAMEVSDLVTVSTPPLARVMSRLNPNVKVLRNCLPDWVPDLQRKPHARPCAGWAGGASHGLDVSMIAVPVRTFLDRFPGWDFRIGGNDFRGTFAHDRVYFRKWIPVNMQPRAYYATMRMDFGLAPLAGAKFDESKSAIKVIEYGALGIPSVASDFGPYPDFIRHGENGFLARTEDEWLEYMSLLASDERLREKMGAAARESARERTIGRHWQEWADAYEDMFARRS